MLVEADNRGFAIPKVFQLGHISPWTNQDHGWRAATEPTVSDKRHSLAEMIVRRLLSNSKYFLLCVIVGPVHSYAVWEAFHGHDRDRGSIVQDDSARRCRKIYGRILCVFLFFFIFFFVNTSEQTRAWTVLQFSVVFEIESMLSMLVWRLHGNDKYV